MNSYVLICSLRLPIDVPQACENREFSASGRDGRKVAILAAVLKTTSRISIADLSTAGIVLTSRETVTIVREVIRQVARGEHLGVPSGHVIRLSASGLVSIEGPVEAGGRPVPRSAQLLDSLLPRFDAPAEIRAPGALRLVIARALGTLDLPPYASLESFADALNRFAAEDSQQTVQESGRPLGGHAKCHHTDRRSGTRG